MAALDLGTNNCRLLIARQAASGFQVIDAFSRIVRLGEGVSQSGELTAAAMDRTIDALKDLLRQDAAPRRLPHAVRSPPKPAAAPPTASASWSAAGRDRHRAGDHHHLEEAKLAFSGCMPLLDKQRPFAIVFDIGGGSTELGWLQLEPGRHPRIIAWHSMPIGVVTLSERFGPEPQGRRSRHLLRAHGGRGAGQPGALRPGDRRAPRDRAHAGAAARHLGTVTTLAGIRMELPRYDRSVVDGSFPDFGDVDRINPPPGVANLRRAGDQSCIGYERADLVVAGCAILSAICRQWPIGRLRVADRGVREGILMSLMTGPRLTASIIGGARA